MGISHSGFEHQLHISASLIAPHILKSIQISFTLYYVCILGVHFGSKLVAMDMNPWLTNSLVDRLFYLPRYREWWIGMLTGRCLAVMFTGLTAAIWHRTLPNGATLSTYCRMVTHGVSCHIRLSESNLSCIKQMILRAICDVSSSSSPICDVSSSWHLK